MLPLRLRIKRIDRIKIEVQNNKGLIVGGDLNITGEDALKIKKYLKKFLSEETKPTTVFSHKLFKWVQTKLRIISRM